jgi:hypothetical protein
MHCCIEYGVPQYPADLLFFRIRSTKISKNNNAEDRKEWELTGWMHAGVSELYPSSGTFTQIRTDNMLTMWSHKTTVSEMTLPGISQFIFLTLCLLYLATLSQLRYVPGY